MITDQAVTLPELYSAELPELFLKKNPLPQGIRRVYALGNGDSHHAALAASQAFSEWTDVEYLPMPAYTFMAKELPRMKPERAAETLVVCISASGSSKLAVDILTAVREKGLGRTLSMTGRPGCALDACAEYTLSVAIQEKGRSPGIRTYAASLCGILQLACRLGGHENLLSDLADALKKDASALPAVLKASEEAALRAAGWDWPHLSVLGCDGLLGCAQFTAAKFAEGCGLYAAGQELEEWCHVESMTYPLNAPVMIFHSCDADRAQCIKVSDTAHRAGRKVIIVSAASDGSDIRAAADEAVFLGLCCQNALSPLFHYIPGLYLARVLAEKFGRAMFLSDQPFSLF